MRGKAPPIDIKLSKAQRLGKLVFKEKSHPEPTENQMSWLKANCLNCTYRNVEKMVTSKLTDEAFLWKHICCHRGPTRRLAYQERKANNESHWNITVHSNRDCSGFKLEEIIP